MVVGHLLACWQPGVNYKHGRKKETFGIYLSSTLKGKQVGLLGVCHNKAEKATWESTNHEMDRFGKIFINEIGVVASVSALGGWRQAEGSEVSRSFFLDAKLKSQPGIHETLSQNKQKISK